MMTEDQEKESREERGANPNMIRDQREANAHLVTATIRAQELTELAEVAQARAEPTANEPRVALHTPPIQLPALVDASSLFEPVDERARNDYR